MSTRNFSFALGWGLRCRRCHPGTIPWQPLAETGCPVGQRQEEAGRPGLDGGSVPKAAGAGHWKGKRQLYGQCQGGAEPWPPGSVCWMHHSESVPHLGVLLSQSLQESVGEAGRDEGQQRAATAKWGPLRRASLTSYFLCAGHRRLAVSPVL